MPEKGKVSYICDGEIPECKKANCYKNGGGCRRTTNIEHALNFEKKPCDYGYKEKNK